MYYKCQIQLVLLLPSLEMSLSLKSRFSMSSLKNVKHLNANGVKLSTIADFGPKEKILQT